MKRAYTFVLGLGLIPFCYSTLGFAAEVVTLRVPRSMAECEALSLDGSPINRWPSPADLFIDAHCAKLLIKELDPKGKGVVSLFGSASLRPNHVAYHASKQLIRAWSSFQETRPPEERLPLLTGGGPGLMEASNCGANAIPTELSDDAKRVHRRTLAERRARGEALNLSLGFGSAFAVPPALVGVYTSGSRLWELNDCVTHGYIFRSFAVRESEMIDRARISLIVPGGVGTEWEFFEALTKIQTGKAPNNGGRKAPLVILFQATALDGNLSVDEAELRRVVGPDYRQLFAQQEGDLKAYWASLMARLGSMVRLGTIKAKDLSLFKCAKSASEALALMKAELTDSMTSEMGKCESGSLDKN